MPPRKYQGHVSSARRRSPPSPQPPAPAFPNKYLPPRRTHSTRSHRRVGPRTSRAHLSATAVRRVGLHLYRAGEITRPHHHHPRIAKKSFSRLSSLLAVSLSSPRPHPPLAAKSALGRRRLAVGSLVLERAPSRNFPMLLRVELWWHRWDELTGNFNTVLITGS
ncbi:hypothetical protein BS78_03G038700 [Paspalum vaginatum]|nr:hypothetical protein BS78_03G038700 [Paspalum vaginatum]